MHTAHLVEVLNPFEPLRGHKVTEIAHGHSVRATLAQHYPGFTEFASPTLVMLDGRPLLRASWDTEIVGMGGVLSVVTLAGELVTVLLIVAVVLAVAAIVMAFVLQPPKPGQLPEADSVFNLSGQRNQIRLRSPIEVPYGRCRLWPSYAARPYTQYIGNEQWQFQLFCLGQGSYEVGQVYIEDTPIENFQDVEYAVYPPGVPATLFPDSVVTSTEVSNLELFGTNEAEYTGNLGPYVANPAFTKINRLEVDLSFPQGLYLATDSGTLAPVEVTALLEYREIDDGGTAVGSWQTLVAFTKELATNTPQRFTVGVTVPDGRYEVRGARTNDKNTDLRAGNQLKWESLRGFRPSTKNYGDVTMFAVKARATNNLNDNASNRINLVATRKLPVFTAASGTWSEPMATRSLVWAFVDVFSSAYGGQLDLQFMDLQTLAAMDADYNARGIYFDHVFDQRTTVWEAATVIARVGRALPMLNGSQVYMVADTIQNAATAVFTPDNMISGTFRWELKPAGITEYDGLEVEYMEATTWKPETVLCLLPGDVGDNPERITLYGCTDRTNAYREGLYMRAVRKKVRWNVKFATGLEGHIPAYGDLVLISHDLPRWGQSGLVVAVSGFTLTLNMAPTFTPGVNHKLLLRRRDGSQLGPFDVYAGTAPNIVELVTGPSTPIGNGDLEEYPIFTFGVEERWAKYAKVVNTTPGDDDTVEIHCAAYVEEVYGYDTAVAPALGAPDLPVRVPDLPVVTGLRVVAVQDAYETATATWDPALGAQRYVVQKSPDGVNWEHVTTTTRTNVTFRSTRAAFYVRVSGFNKSAGPWVTWTGRLIVDIPAPPNDLNLRLTSDWTDTTVSVAWTAYDTADSYTVRVYQDGGVTKMHEVTGITATTWSYTYATALSDGATNRRLRISVTPVVSLVEFTPSAIDIENEPPPPITGVGASYFGASSTTITYTVSWSADSSVDLSGYRVYGSFEPGFACSASTLLASTTSLSTTVDVPTTHGGHAAFYFRVVALDTWDDEADVGLRYTIAKVAPASGFSSGFSNGFI